MLSAILVVTLVVADLDSTRSAYVDWLDYQIVAEDSVSSELAASWAAPTAAGSRSVLLQPASGGTMWLRLIERPHAAGYRAMQSTGWTANEILVEDPFDLAERFSKPGSPFRVVGPPAPLGSNGKVIAMQAIGPAGELNYFTRIPPEGGTFIKTPAAGRVDRTFIAVVGGRSMASMSAFYRDTLGMAVLAPYPSAVQVVNDARGLPSDYQMQLAVVPISPASILELDEYPLDTSDRVAPTGDLPAGMAMVSFIVESLDSPKLAWRSPPRLRSESPYSGRRAGVVVGAAGEWIELIERETR
jgi:catechol 2,3-dioxygenase-like lactoylglutathione lyase family enzyme